MSTSTMFFNLRMLFYSSLVAISAFFFLGCRSPDAQQAGSLNQNASSFEETNASKIAEVGWKMLFDGQTTAGWRGINQDHFPNEGWEIKDGVLLVNSTDGTESGNGRDIIATGQYSQFVLDWEWKMLTKGGNSGVKYFVKEGLSDNKNTVQVWSTRSLTMKTSHGCWKAK